MAKPRITQTTPYDSPGTQGFSEAKNLRKISTGSPPTGAPNRGGVCSNRRFSTNISLYPRNAAREGHSLMGTHTRSIEWHYFQWPWVTP